MRWYVVRTKLRQEKQAEFHLGQFCAETFLPMLRRNKMVGRAPQVVVSPLFPGYMFARFDVKDQYRAVNYARGVLNIVEFGQKPAEVSEELINAIRGRLEAAYMTHHSEPFKNGQIVQIKTGPMAGIEAIFIKEMTVQQRVLLLLKTLGLHAKVIMDIDQVSLPQAL